MVKTNGDAIMAVFATQVEAVQAALDMLDAIDEFNQKISQKLILKIGIHAGRSIAITLNNRLDYFGQTVNIAARVQGLAGAGEIYITEAVYQAEGVGEALKDHDVTAEETQVKGVSEKLKVYRIADHAAGHQR
jgi:class 3 adenylate cyclase